MVIWRFLVSNQPLWVSNVSNLTAITILGSLIAVYHRFTCDQPRCARFSHAPVKGTTYRTCRKHTTGEVHQQLHARHAHRHPGAHAHLNVDPSAPAAPAAPTGGTDAIPEVPSAP